jgi:hypothetical protein
MIANLYYHLLILFTTTWKCICRSQIMAERKSRAFKYQAHVLLHFLYGTILISPSITQTGRGGGGAVGIYPALPVVIILISSSITQILPHRGMLGGGGGVFCLLPGFCKTNETCKIWGKCTKC